MLFFLILPLLLMLPASAEARAFKPSKPTKHRLDKQPVAPINKLKKEAVQGDMDAQYQLALKYDRGTGLPKDPQMAAAWFKAAAEQGHAQAQFFLGVKYEKGDGVSTNKEIALQWYAAAADNGFQPASKALLRLHNKK